MNPSIRILIIDDDPLMRALTRSSLLRYATHCAWEIIELPDGAQALDYIAAADPPPDIILLDIHMPVMGGIDFLRAYERLALAAQVPDIYILSTVPVEMSGTHAFSHIVRDYFDKPLTPDHIQQMIDHYRLRLCSGDAG